MTEYKTSDNEQKYTKTSETFSQLQTQTKPFLKERKRTQDNTTLHLSSGATYSGADADVTVLERTTGTNPM